MDEIQSFFLFESTTDGNYHLAHAFLTRTRTRTQSHYGFDCSGSCMRCPTVVSRGSSHVFLETASVPPMRGMRCCHLMAATATHFRYSSDSWKLPAPNLQLVRSNLSAACRRSRSLEDLLVWSPSRRRSGLPPKAVSITAKLKIT